MTQEAIVISTTPPLPGLKLVQDLNAALETIATDFSGSVDPASNAGPYMTWADTANKLIKRRNAANTEWTTEGALLRWHIPTMPLAELPAVDVGLIFVDNDGFYTWTGTAYARTDLSLSVIAAIKNGSVSEVGANANGTYYKYGGGDMICFIRVPVSGVVAWTPGSPSYGQITGITFPAAFVATPRLVGMTAIDSDVSGRSAYLSAVTSATTSNVAAYVSSPNSSPPTGGTITVTGVAIGRWKA